MGRLLRVIILVAVVIAAGPFVASCGEGDDTPGSGSAMLEPTNFSDLETEPASATKSPTPKPKATKSAWPRIIVQHHSNDAQFNTDKNSPFFIPEGARLRITWEVWPTQDEYNWAAVVFRKGQTPDNSLGVSPLLMTEAGTPDAGSKTFRVKPGRQYYLWTELWHCDGDFEVSEHR